MSAELNMLVQEARAGSAAAWDRLFQRYQLPLLSFVCALIRDRDAGLAIIQDTFFSAVRYLDSLREDAKFGSWLFGIARQKCGHHWQRSAREHRVFDRTEEPSDELPGPGSDNPAAWMVRRECEAAFMAALELLPAAHREVVVLHCLREFSLEEIAEVAAVPVGTVKSRLHHARRKLRELLEDHL